MHWRTARRRIHLNRPLVMGILNVTPDSFSDGGRYHNIEQAVAHSEQMIADGADLIDIGGESTRPGGAPVSVAQEIERVIPVVELMAKRFDIPLSVDTTKSAVGRAAIDAGAEIVNDISGLRFDPLLADEVARSNAGLILMHSRGEASSLHTQPATVEIFDEVFSKLAASVDEAARRGVLPECIVVDPGFGFGKTPEQNIELLAGLDRFVREFAPYPVLVGPSRKSFIGKILDQAPPDQRLYGTVATVALSVMMGARIVRVHDVKAAADAVRVAFEVRLFGES